MNRRSNSNTMTSTRIKDLSGRARKLHLARLNPSNFTWATQTCRISCSETLKSQTPTRMSRWAINSWSRKLEKKTSSRCCSKNMFKSHLNPGSLKSISKIISKSFKRFRDLRVNLTSSTNFWTPTSEISSSSLLKILWFDHERRWLQSSRHCTETSHSIRYYLRRK